MGTSALIYVNATESIRAGNLECSRTSTGEKYRDILHAESKWILIIDRVRCRVSRAVSIEPRLNFAHAVITHSLFLSYFLSHLFIILHPHCLPSLATFIVRVSRLCNHFLLGINTLTAAVTNGGRFAVAVSKSCY